LIKREIKKIEAPNSFTYGTMLTLYTRLRDLQKAKEIWKEMKNQIGMRITPLTLVGVAKLALYEVHLHKH
jgi:pentatricopeptide repeat protein